MKLLSKRKLLAAVTLVLAAAAVAIGTAFGGSKDAPASAQGLGQLSGLLPRDHLTVESALQVDLSKQSVRLPLYKGRADGQTAWFVLLDSSDQGITHDLGVNYARPRRQLRPEARQPCDRRSRGGADGDARLADA
jgi:hypothetical protein